MSRRTFDFDEVEKEILEDMLEELFLLKLEYSEKSSEVTRLLNNVCLDVSVPESNYMLLYLALFHEIKLVKNDLKSMDSMLSSIKKQEAKY